MTYPSQYPANASLYQNASYGANYAPQPVVLNPEPPLNQPWYDATFGGAFSRFWKKYATFSGRASRSEYWLACLANVLITIIACITIVGIFLLPFYSIAILIPTLAIAVRRLHDSNLSGVWLLLPIGLNFGASVTSFFVLFTMRWGPFEDFFDFLDYYEAHDYSLDDDYFIDYVFDNIEFTETSIALFMLSAILSIASFVVTIVLLVRAPKPEGARFDAPVYQSYTAMPSYVANQQGFTYQAPTPTQPMPYGTATPKQPTTNPFQ